MSRRHTCRRARSRAGSIAILAVFVLIILLAMVAFAIDVGLLMMAKTQLQRSADSAALAASWAMLDNASPTENPWTSGAFQAANNAAVEFVAYNNVFGESPVVTANLANSASGDVVIGQFSNGSMSFGSQPDYNAVRVRVSRTQSKNGEIRFFFAHVFGRTSSGLSADGTAGLVTKVAGFRVPSDNSNLPILPIALDEISWNELVSGAVTDDNWSWNEETEQVEAGGDDICEVTLYPEDTGSPGNFGTVDIGPGSGTNYLSTQILNGITPADLAHHGGELTFDGYGQLALSGDTGISNGIKDELEAIIGMPRLIPIYRAVDGTGTNAVYTIVKWAGVRLMEVDMSDGDKHILVQPANVVTKGTVAAHAGDPSDFVYSSPRLVN